MLTAKETKSLILFGLLMVGLVFAGLTISIVWTILELMFGPLFPDWFYYLISLEL
jgi:hypothetical protein